MAQSSGLSIVGLVEAESHVAPIPDDPQTPGRAMIERLVHNGCSYCSYFAVRIWARCYAPSLWVESQGRQCKLRAASGTSESWATYTKVAVLCGFTWNCVQMDNAKLGEVLNDGSNAPPFQVCPSVSRYPLPRAVAL